MAQRVIDSGFYADCPLSKQALSAALRTSHPTIWRHAEIAYFDIPEYKEDFPELPQDKWIEKRRKRDSEVPLSPYQSWVISLIQASFAQLHKKSAVQQFIALNPYLFSRKSYHAQLIKVAEMMSA